MRISFRGSRGRVLRETQEVCVGVLWGVSQAGISGVEEAGWSEPCEGFGRRGPHELRDISANDTTRESVYERSGRSEGLRLSGRGCILARVRLLLTILS